MTIDDISAAFAPAPSTSRKPAKRASTPKKPAKASHLPLKLTHYQIPVKGGIYAYTFDKESEAEQRKIAADAGITFEELLESGNRTRPFPEGCFYKRAHKVTVSLRDHEVRRAVGEVALCLGESVEEFVHRAICERIQLRAQNGHLKRTKSGRLYNIGWKCKHAEFFETA